jgi:hypothetical protein
MVNEMTKIPKNDQSQNTSRDYKSMYFTISYVEFDLSILRAEHGRMVQLHLEIHPPSSFSNRTKTFLQ